ncbi:MAG: hypothetical protein FWF25_03070 [Propionibacteriaceae bacterium]|nr:hypothetical protein [Propionibacteriaceae bacterium]
MITGRIDRFELSKKFIKAFQKLTSGEQRRVNQALTTATVDLSHPALRSHELKGNYAGTVSISAGGDLRIHIHLIEEDDLTIAIVQSVGSHSQLYG